MSTETGEELLSSATVLSYLQSRGLIEDGPAQVRELSGGVSNVTLAVIAGEQRLVVKQALPELRVQARWSATPERALTEAVALQVLGAIAPGTVPGVRDVDAERWALTVEMAPDSWVTWKPLLMAGEADPQVARRVGELLARWHAGSAVATLPARLEDRGAFTELRTNPFYRTIAERHPAIGNVVDELIAEMDRFRPCLVHGDFSPKNILVGEEGLWGIDCETAHRGDPVYDTAFLLSHLVLKTIARPSAESAYLACAKAFQLAYEEGIPHAMVRPRSLLARHLGCLLVARVDGKSPAPYLDQAGRRLARDLGLTLAQDPPADLDGAWQALGRLR